MFRVSVLYPATANSRFDLDDYLNRHTPMVEALLGPALRGVQIDRGIAGFAPGSPAPFHMACHLLFDSAQAFAAAFGPHNAVIQADIVNYTDITPVIWMNEVLRNG